MSTDISSRSIPTGDSHGPASSGVRATQEKRTSEEVTLQRSTQERITSEEVTLERSEASGSFIRNALVYVQQRVATGDYSFFSHSGCAAIRKRRALASNLASSGRLGSRFSRGDEVIFKGLAGDSELNGCRGVVAADAIPDMLGWVGVHVQGDDFLVSYEIVSYENLELLASESPEPEDLFSLAYSAAGLLAADLPPAIATTAGPDLQAALLLSKFDDDVDACRRSKSRKGRSSGWFIPENSVLSKHGTKLVTTLAQGMKLRHGLACATVDSIRSLPLCKRDVVTITFVEHRTSNDMLKSKGVQDTEAEASVTVPSSLPFAVRRGTQYVRRCAGGILPGDFLWTQSTEAKVLDVSKEVKETELVELTFADANQLVHIAAENSPLAIEVFGNRKSLSVKLLTFKRHDNFKTLFFEQPELLQCRDALNKAGLSMDLSQLGLGPGKLVVDVEISYQVIACLRARHCQGDILKRSTIVIQAEWEPIVRCLVQNHPERRNENRVVDERMLDISRGYSVLHEAEAIRYYKDHPPSIPSGTFS